MAAPLPESIHNPLAEVTACPACGQLISGLPPVGRCPECGGEYDRHEVVVFGKRRWHAWGLYGGAISTGVVFALSLNGYSHTTTEIVISVFWGLSLLGTAVAAISSMLVERPG